MKQFNSLSDTMKAAVIGALAVIVGAIITGIFTLRSSVTSQSQPTPTPSVTVTGNPPSYVSGLSSTNLPIFLKSFSQALQYQDVPNIEDNTEVPNFMERCDPSIILTTRKGEPCDHNWKDIKSLLLTDKLEFGFPQDAQTVPKLTGACANDPNLSEHVLGTVDNKGFTLPIPHIVTAVFDFECTSCGSETPWAWTSVYICG